MYFNNKHSDMVRVIAKTLDFKLAYNLRVALESTQFKFFHEDFETKLREDDILVQAKGDPEVAHPRRIVLTHKANKAKILSVIYGLTEKGKTAYVGIDPGKTIGVAILLNSSVLITSSFNKVVTMERWIVENLSSMVYSELTIRIGNAGGKYKEEIVDYIHKQFDHLGRIEIVDETGSSAKRSKRNLPRVHENAAVSIAKRGD